MSKSRSSALKRDREQRKAEKHAEKKRRREQRKEGGEDSGASAEPGAQDGAVAASFDSAAPDRVEPGPAAPEHGQ